MSSPDRAKPPRRWRRRLRLAAEVLTILVAIPLLLLWCSVPNTAPLADENPTTTAFIELRRAQAEEAGRPFALKWQWKPIGKISRYLRAAVIYAEDYRFYKHDGVDWGAIESAIESNLDKGALAIGGSTITQQHAKNLYLSPSRTFIRKVREMLIAFSLEDHLTKARILELYLNVVEWGDGVFGAEAAARHWFGKSAQALAPAEAVRLAIALPNPTTRAPNVRTPELTKKAVRIIRLLRMQGLIDSGQERIALDAVGAQNLQVLPSRYAPDGADDDQTAPSPTTTAPARPPDPVDDPAPAPAVDPAPDPAPGSGMTPPRAADPPDPTPEAGSGVNVTTPDL
jgi:monofunctional biosynthetic peptidoglycan transglycosylase